MIDVSILPLIFFICVASYFIGVFTYCEVTVFEELKIKHIVLGILGCVGVIICILIYFIESTINFIKGLPSSKFWNKTIKSWK